MKSFIESLRSFIAVALWVVLLVFVVGTVRTFAATLGPVAPDPSDSGPNGGEHVFLIRKNIQNGKNTRATLIAYYPPGVQNWNTKYIQIEQDPAWGCVADDAGLSKAQDRQFVKVELSANGGGDDVYYIPYSQICNSHYGKANQTGEDGNNTMFGKYKLPTQPGSVNNASGLYQVNIVISYNPNLNASDISTGKNNSIMFRVIGYDPDGTHSGNLMLGPNGTGSGTYNFPIVGKPSTDGTKTSIQVPFGLPCNVDTDQLNTVGVYDADNGGFSWTLKFQVKDLDGGPVDFQGGKGGSPNSGTFSGNNAFTPNNGNKDEATVKVDMLPYHRYELDVTGLDGFNTVVVSLPTDTIFGAIKCQPPATNNPTLTCNGFSATPSVVEPGDPVIATFGAHTTGFNGNTPNTLNAQVTSDNGKNTVGTLAVNTSGGSYYSGTFNVGTFTTAGSHTINAVISDPSGKAPPITCSGTITVVNQPYLSVYGSDAIAGKTSGVSGTGNNLIEQCVTSPASDPGGGLAGFIAWNNGDSGSSGAGAQFAVQALGMIDDFASGRGSNPNNSPSGLAFSNSGTQPTAKPRVFGGNYGTIDGVGCDYTTGVTFNSTVTTADYTNTGSPAGGLTGTTNILVKNHDAIISGSIMYAGTTTWNLATIPSFRLVVQGGNIIIRHNVTELDGTYIAERNSSAAAGSQGGVIYTCARDDNTPYDPGDDDFYTGCSTPLTIYGSFVAQQVQFLRTSGSVGNASPGDNYGTAGPAEKFVYSPEVWLANLKAQPGNTDASVTGLPPTL